MRKRLEGHHDGLGLNDLVTIYADDPDPNAGNSSHVYSFVMTEDGITQEVGKLQFQHGPRHEETSVSGILDSAVLEVLIDRYQGFQSSQYACVENEEVLDLLFKAKAKIRERAQRRSDQGTLGTREGS